MSAAPAPAPIDKNAAIRELASRALSKRRLLPFIQRMNPRYMAGWVHEDICRRLERFSDAVEAGLSPRLMLLMPPRHGKSEIASKTFPAWHLGRFPDHEIIACSYNVDLALGFSRKVQALFDDPAYQTVFEARLNPNQRPAAEWTLHHNRGGYVAAGVGGGITGKGAHVLIIDDPIKNAEEADSADIREKLWDWYGSTAYTRLAPGAGVLVIQTWWHDDDLAGKLQMAAKADPEADQFEIIKYPALAEQAEFIDTTTDEIVRVPTSTGFDANEYNAVLAEGADKAKVYMEKLERMARAAAKGLSLDNTALKYLRPKGAGLHEERYDVKKLKRIRANIHPRHWSALYQQNPVPDDGSYFTKDQFKRMDTPPPGALSAYVHVYQTWDFAISEKQQNDFTVGTVGIQDDLDQINVAEVIRFKSGDAFFIVEAILAAAKRWYHPSLILGFEDGQIFRSIEALLKKRMEELGFYVPYEVLRPLTDKMARARPLQGRMQQGKVFFNSKGEWYETVRNEMLRFPAGVHDDCVDSLAWLVQLIVGKPAPSRPKPVPPKSWKDGLNKPQRGSGHMAA